MSKLTSRKFLSAIVLAGVVMATGLDWISLKDDTVVQLLTVGLGWIGVEGAVDVVRVLREWGD